MFVNLNPSRRISVPRLYLLDFNGTLDLANVYSKFRIFSIVYQLSIFETIKVSSMKTWVLSKSLKCASKELKSVGDTVYP